MLFFFFVWTPMNIGFADEFVEIDGHNLSDFGDIKLKNGISMQND